MYKARAKEALRFSGVGIGTALLDYVLLNLLASWLSLPIIVANLISAPIASFLNYHLSKKIVFEDKMHNERKSLLIYALIMGFGIVVIQNIVLHILNATFMPSVAQAIDDSISFIPVGVEAISLNLSKLVAIAVSAVWNFFMLRRFVFVNEDDKRT